MEAAVSGVEVGLDRHEEEGAYDADAEVEVGQGCADVAGEWSGLMKVWSREFPGWDRVFGTHLRPLLTAKTAKTPSR